MMRSAKLFLIILALALPVSHSHASNLKQFFGGAASSSPKILKVVTHGSNSYPACPAAHTALGCRRGSGTTTDASTGWLVDTTMVNESGLIIETASTSSNYYSAYACYDYVNGTYNGGQIYNNGVSIKGNGVVLASVSQTSYITCDGNTNNFSWGICICKQN